MQHGDVVKPRLKLWRSSEILICYANLAFNLTELTEVPASLQVKSRVSSLPRLMKCCNLLVLWCALFLIRCLRVGEPSTVLKVSLKHMFNRVTS